MKGACAVLCLVAFLAVVACAGDARLDSVNVAPRRLIKVSEADPGQWMSTAGIAKLQQEKKGFIDITDVPFPISAVSDAPVPPPLPNQPQQKQLVQSLNAQLSTTGLKSNVEKLSSFYTRYYTSETGVEAAEWIYNTLETYKGKRDDIQVQFFNNDWAQPSVIARSLSLVSSSSLLSNISLITSN